MRWRISPSPSAGTEAYRPEVLVRALQRLLEAAVIDADAATRACKRTLTIKLALPWGADPDALAEHVLRSEEHTSELQSQR